MTENQDQKPEDIIAALQRRWILEGWEKAEGESFVFKDKVGHFYDWDAEGATYYDTFDPELRIARSPGEWRDAFEGSFNAMHSALHAVTDEPDVLVRGETAAATFEFCAVAGQRRQGDQHDLPDLACLGFAGWRMADRPRAHVVPTGEP